MEKGRLENVSGTLMLTVPEAILQRLQLREGSEVELATTGQALLLRAGRSNRPTLAELIAQSDRQAFEHTDEDREWLDSPPLGRELI